MAEKNINSGIVYNMLATGSKIKGDFSSDSDFRIDGIFEGNISCKGKVIIGTNGVLIGNLTCTNAEELLQFRKCFRSNLRQKSKATSKPKY